MTRWRWLPATAVVFLASTLSPAAALATPSAAAKDNTAPCTFAGKLTACQSTDPRIKIYVPFQGTTTGCTFDIAVNWGDNSKTQQVILTNPPDGNDFLAGHSYAYSDVDVAFTITINGQVTAGSCTFNPYALSFALLTCTSRELSGPSWASRFPISRSVAALSGRFRKDVSSFIAAMRHAAISVRTISTRLPVERAYLMHYSWLVARRKLSPLHVPYFPGHGKHTPPVSICWVHVDRHGANIRASVIAARNLAAALGVGSLPRAPPLTSLRTKGFVIVMSTTWTRRKITILNASGQSVTIRSDPHDGLNKTLITVGATYGVIHFRNAKQAPNDWSVNGD